MLSTTYNSSFNANTTAEAKATLPPAIYQTFEDPTSELDKKNFPRIEAEVRALPNGDEILATTIAAQKEGVAKAIQNIFLGSVFAAIAVLVLAITIPEIPLRKGFGAAAVPVPVAPGAAPKPVPERSSG